MLYIVTGITSIALIIFGIVDIRRVFIIGTSLWGRRGRACERFLIRIAFIISFLVFGIWDGTLIEDAFMREDFFSTVIPCAIIILLLCLLPEAIRFGIKIYKEKCLS